MPVNPLRIKTISKKDSQGAIIYRMCRDLRVHDNDALLYAYSLAKEKGEMFIVEYPIWNYLWEGSTRRFYDFVIPLLKETEKDLRVLNIPLVVTLITQKDKYDFSWKNIPFPVGGVVIDQLPLSFMKRWKNFYQTSSTDISLYEVDAHNCIPVWETSDKQEFAARTIRSKVQRKLALFLESYEDFVPFEGNKKALEAIPACDWKQVEASIICDESISGFGEFVPSKDAARERLNHFLTKGILNYDTARNEINTDGQSNLSPYLAHGVISRRRVIQEVCRTFSLDKDFLFETLENPPNHNIAAFVEETVVRAELAENFCYYNNFYDSYEGFPAWAKQTLEGSRTDTREYVYSFEEFKNAKTHDDLWNAAQMQMVLHGKMHGYMRMYWAKKILEWSKSPEDAMRTAVRLNDLYELDGRDPNGYTGCAWSIGGLHDRAWFRRPIFGMVRLMASSGVKKRGDLKEYQNKVLGIKEKLF